MQSLMTNFEEITQLVNTMTTVLGAAGKNYAETEQQLTDQFNQIVAQYDGKSGGFSTEPMTTTSAQGTTTTTDTATSTASTATTGQTYTTTSPSSDSSSDSSSSNDNTGT
jgi:uncharacterized protein YyaL (SSP411 family)